MVQFLGLILGQGGGGGPEQQMDDWPEVLNSLRLQKLSFFFEKGGLNISSS